MRHEPDVMLMPLNATTRNMTMTIRRTFLATN